MKKFEIVNSDSLNRGNYKVDILDIWCQNDKVVAYVEGSSVYKVELVIKGKRIDRYYCSCPSSEGGMDFCKHLSGIVNYLRNNAVLELECVEEDDTISFDLSMDKIIKKFENKINSLVDRYRGSISCYNSECFADIVFNYCEYVEYLMENKKVDDAFYYLKQICLIIEGVYVDSCDDYDDAIEGVRHYIKLIIEEGDYLERVIAYLLDNYKKVETDKFARSLLRVLINDFSSDKVNEIIKVIKIDDYHRSEFI